MHEIVTIVNHEGEARVVYLVTVKCISVVNHYHPCFIWLVTCSNFYNLWSGLDKLQAVPLICMASTLQKL